MKIIFVHGWGADAQYWDALASQVTGGAEAQRVDLGYTDKPQHTPQDEALYITHSLGTLWALQNRAPQMRGLIALNGFACFHAFTNAPILAAMQTGLAANPARQMRAFYRAANMPPEGALNESTLATGLECLAQDDARAALSALDVPVLALLGAQDTIVPIEPAQEQWQGHDVNICEDGDHNIPQSHAKWCADHINAFIERHAAP